MNTTLKPARLTVDELHDRLEELVFMVLSIRRSVAGTAETLSRYERTRQERFIESVAVVRKTSTELAYNFCLFGPPALDRLHGDEWQDWVLYLLDTYDNAGVIGAISAMQKVDEYAQTVRRAGAGVRLHDIANVLEHFVLGLNGRVLQLTASDETFTDTETLFLPAHLEQFDSPERNFAAYKITAVHLWAQTWFGTFRRDLARTMAAFDDPQLALTLLHALETMRLDAGVARELPGVYREMCTLCGADPRARWTGAWQEIAAALQAPDACVDTSLTLLPRVYTAGLIPPPVFYQGRLLPERAAEVMSARMQRDRDELGVRLAILMEEHKRNRRETRKPQENTTTFEMIRRDVPELPEGFRYELQLDGEPISPPAEITRLLESINQDLGQIPDTYLEAAGHGDYRPGNAPPADNGVRSPTRGTLEYDEWDHARKQYRKDWCLLHQRDVHPAWDEFVPATLNKYRGVLKHIYRTFEALRGEAKRLKQQPFGDDVDIDAAVTAYADTRAGREGNDRVFLKKLKMERDVAVMFMVDMSGSTKGWINHIERESLVLLCEALETLGDRYGIYGFSGFTHKRCELFRIKRLDEPYNDDVRARISGIRPQDYTRMGVAIRHLTRVLTETEARTKLLITLSDGRPDDQDGYRGSYGIEDTRQALMEARYRGVHPYCITIDEEAMDYLPHMYGPAGFSVVNDVRKLPYKVSDIYRRIAV